MEKKEFLVYVGIGTVLVFMVGWIAFGNLQPANNGNNNSDVPVHSSQVNLPVQNTRTSELDNGNGTFTVSYNYRITNNRSNRVTVTEITNTFSQGSERFTDLTVQSLSSNKIATNGSFNAVGQPVLNSYDFELDPGESASINATFVFDYSAGDLAIDCNVRAVALERYVATSSSTSTSTQVVTSSESSSSSEPSSSSETSTSQSSTSSSSIGSQLSTSNSSTATASQQSTSSSSSSSGANNTFYRDQTDRDYPTYTGKS